MKELHLQDLLNMADPSAHDSIGDLWNEKTVHFLVIFTSADQDFELIGAGPTLPYKTLDEAAAHTIPGKKPEFYVKCPAAIAGRMQPRLAPTIGRPTGNAPASTPAVAPSATPSLKGRTNTPFAQPALKPPANAMPQGPGGGAQSAALVPASASQLEAPNPPPANAPAADRLSELQARERAIAQREQELAALAASLKIREAALRNRETAVAESEERLLNQTHKPG